MSAYLSLKSVRFSGPNKEAVINFTSGVNVICGASDTGKSFLAETIDFMLGGSSLKEIPERVPYASMRSGYTASLQGEVDWEDLRLHCGELRALQHLELYGSVDESLLAV